MWWLKRALALTCVCCVVVVALSLLGCRSGSSPHKRPLKGGTHGNLKWPDDAPLLGGTSAFYGQWGDGISYIVWTDRCRDWDGTGMAKHTPKGEHDEYRAVQDAGDGKRIEIHFEMEETEEGRKGTLTINGVGYDLAKGSLFLVTTKGPQPEVVQLNRDTLALRAFNAHYTFEELGKTVPEVAAFLAKAKKPK